MRDYLLLFALPLLAVGGCSRDQAGSNEVDIANAADAARDSVDNYAALPDERTTPGPVETQRPVPTPIAPTPVPTTAPSLPVADAGDATADAAAAVVRRYYDLIAAGRYQQAWQLWDNDGRASEMTAQAFVASFAKYADYRAEVGRPGRVDAGAGQRYVTVPVRISGRLKDGGQPFAMAGPVTLHRTGAIDGSTPEQRRWRISASGVRPRPADAAPGGDAPDRVTTRYRCKDGTAFTAVFDNRADAVTLRFAGGDTVRLPGARPASGIWYRDARHELRGKGREATYTRGRAMPVDCLAVR